MRVSQYFVLLPMHYTDFKMHKRECSFKDKLELGKKNLNET
jgi:hypothetical protein